MKGIKSSWRFGLLALACAGGLMAGQPMVSNMQLTGAGNNIMDGIYIGPYYATVDGTPNVAIICDDFIDESYLGQQWQADVTNVAANAPTWLSVRDGLAPAQQSQMYATAAYLATQLMNGGTCPPGTVKCKAANYAGDIQFAIWQEFDPADPQGTPFSYLTGNDATNAAAWLNYAKTNAPSSSTFANVLVYSPAGGGPPQEFLRVTAPEPAAILLLLVELIGVAGLIAYTRRRKARSNT